jgi:hypothetical protein
MCAYDWRKSESWEIWGLAEVIEKVVFQDQQGNLEMNKAQLIRQIVISLRESLAVLEKAARASHAEATHESSKADSKYDMGSP